ncbi:MAG: peptidylprolyl isomerase [Rhodospirillaceae bacterium]
MIEIQAVRTPLIAAGLIAAGALAAVPWVSPAMAAAGQEFGASLERIAAVVNDDAISLRDLEARLRLALLSSGLPDGPDIRQRLGPQVLRSLIDERLQLQEAKRIGIAVGDQEVSGALARIAEQNKLPPGGMERMLASRGVPVVTLVGQIKANIAWTKLIQRKLKPTVQVGGEEVDAALERLQSNVGKSEYLTAEIFLAVDNAAQDEEVRRAAERLIDQIRAGTPFSSVARQFSQAAGAGNGGDLGWVQPGQLPDDIDFVVTGLRPGTMSQPTRGANGYHILMVREVRTINAGDSSEAQVHLKQMVFPIGPHADRQTQLNRAVGFSQKVRGCEEFDAQLRAAGVEKGGDMGTLRVGDLPPDFARLVTNMPIGQVSQPFGNERQVVVIMVCDRKTPAASMPSRDQISASLTNERLDMLQRRYLIDLKRAAYIDLRM